MKWPFLRRLPAFAVIALATGRMTPAQTGATVSVVRVGFESGTGGSVAAAIPCVVLIEADGALPEPSSGTLRNPNRVYLDFAGARAKTSGVPRTGGSALAIRVALHSDSPPVTRVVVDLSAPVSYSVDTSHRSEGRVRLQLTVSKTTLPSGSTKEESAVRVGTLPAKNVPRVSRTYGDGVKMAVDALERLRPDLSLLDRRSMPSADSLRNDTAQLPVVRTTLTSLKPPVTMASSHGLLQSACGLATLAFETAAKDPDGKVTPETASAAAGALILIDRARAALSSAREGIAPK